MKKIYRVLVVSCLALVACIAIVGCKSSKNREKQETYRQYGINCLKSGDYEEAVKSFQSALDQSIGGIGEVEVDICLYKAKAQYLSGDFEGAEATYAALIDYKEYPESYYQRGCFYFAQGEYDKGIADFDKAIEKDPDNYEIYIGAYEAIYRNIDGDSGAKYLEKALKIKGEDSTDYMMKGRIYFLMKDYDNASENLEKALEKGEKEANFYLAQLFAAKGDNDTSDKYFEDYTKSGEASAADLCSMAETLMLNGDYKTAKNYLEAAQNMPDVTDVRNLKKSIIICYENIGDFENAKLLMDAYIKDYPDDEDAKRDNTFLKTR